MPEVNNYLAIFPKEEELKITCHFESKILKLTGIYLIKEENFKIYYKNTLLETNYNRKTNNNYEVKSEYPKRRIFKFHNEPQKSRGQENPIISNNTNHRTRS